MTVLVHLDNSSIPETKHLIAVNNAIVGTGLNKINSPCRLGMAQQCLAEINKLTFVSTLAVYTTKRNKKSF